MAASARFLDRPSGPEPPPLTSSDGVQDFIHVHPSHRARPVHGPEDRPLTKDQELHRLRIAAVMVIGPPGVEALKLPFLQPVSDGEGETVLLGH